MSTKLASAQGKRFQDHLKDLLDEEISEAGSRLVKALAAEQAGLKEAGRVLREIAQDEARHALLVARSMEPNPFEDFRANVQSSIDGDADAAQREAEFARLARKMGSVELAQLFEQLSSDETRHVEKLKGLIKGR